MIVLGVVRLLVDLHAQGEPYWAGVLAVYAVWCFIFATVWNVRFILRVRRLLVTQKAAAKSSEVSDG